MASFADGAVFAMNGAPLDWSTPRQSEADVVISWDAAVFQMIAEEMRLPLPPQIFTGLPSGEVSLSVIETGLRQEVVLNRVPADLAPVTIELLGHVPATALAVTAVGIDGAGLWQGPIGNMLASQPEMLAEPMPVLLKWASRMGWRPDQEQRHRHADRWRWPMAGWHG